MPNPPRLIEITIPRAVYDRMKLNRNAINPDWSVADYVEHIVESHTQVLLRLAANKRKGQTNA